MNYSLTTVFVVPTNNILPQSGSTENLAQKQFGIFDQSHSHVSVANASGIKNLYFAQGRTQPLEGIGSIKSDKIAKSKIIDFYKVSAESDQVLQITKVSDFKVYCGDQVFLTVRAHNNYLDTANFTGFTQTAVADADCCNCYTDPCQDLNDLQIDTLVDSLVQQFKDSGPFMGGVFRDFIEVYRTGSGPTACIVFTAKKTFLERRIPDVSANPFEFDRTWFDVIVGTNPKTTQDKITDDKCRNTAKVSLIQRSEFTRGSADEIYELEKQYHSNLAPVMKDLVDKPGYNVSFESNVEYGVFYDTFYLRFYGWDDNNWNNANTQDEAVILAIPQGKSGEIESILTAAFGAPQDMTPPDRTTTTTTTSTTSTTTSTTTTFP